MSIIVSSGCHHQWSLAASGLIALASTVGAFFAGLPLLRGGSSEVSDAALARLRRVCRATVATQVSSLAVRLEGNNLVNY